MKWTLDEAIRTFCYLKTCFKNNGYLLTIYGSVVSEVCVGNDLDLAALPLRRNPNPPLIVIEDILRNTRLKKAGDEYRGFMRTYAIILKDEKERLLDIQFREMDLVENHLKESGQLIYKNEQ